MNTSIVSLLNTTQEDKVEGPEKEITEREEWILNPGNNKLISGDSSVTLCGNYLHTSVLIIL